jgi:hypothetical protein
MRTEPESEPRIIILCLGLNLNPPKILCVWMSFQVIFQSSHRSCIVLHLASLILCGSDSFCFEILKERRWLAGAGSVLPLSPLFSLLRPSAKQAKDSNQPAGRPRVCCNRQGSLVVAAPLRWTHTASTAHTGRRRSGRRLAGRYGRPSENSVSRPGFAL